MNDVSQDTAPAIAATGPCPSAPQAPGAFVVLAHGNARRIYEVRELKLCGFPPRQNWRVGVRPMFGRRTDYHGLRAVLATGTRAECEAAMAAYEEELDLWGPMIKRLSSQRDRLDKRINDLEARAEEKARAKAAEVAPYEHTDATRQDGQGPIRAQTDAEGTV